MIWLWQYCYCSHPMGVHSNSICPFKVAYGEGQMPLDHHFIGFDTVQRSARHGLNSNAILSNRSDRSAHLLRRPYENFVAAGIQPFAAGEFQWAGCVTVQTCLNCYEFPRVIKHTPAYLRRDMHHALNYKTDGYPQFFTFRTYPVPRTVWISFVPNSSSIFFLK